MLAHKLRASCAAPEGGEEGAAAAESGGKLQSMTSADVEDVMIDAHVHCNEEMHAQPFETNLSGTTAVDVLLRGGEMHVANVGDSRAVMGVYDPVSKQLLAEALSEDQTPYRKDERERVKAAGAIVMTIDQVDGHEPIHENWGTTLGSEIDSSGDPPRVWDSRLERPGSAFTRSLGDGVAEKLGVFAEPEMLSRTVTANDKFLIIASDGVFEFLTSQAVVDMVSKFDDPLEACRSVVAEAYRLWLQFEVRTDDITMICVFFKDIKISDAGSPVLESRKLMNESRPVQRRLGKEKRLLANVKAVDMSEVAAFRYDACLIHKSRAELDQLDTSTRANFLFMHLPEDTRRRLFGVMGKLSVRKGDTIITEGDEGDKFYLIISGHYNVQVGGVEVMKYTKAGECFGELSLMYGKPRAATVTAVSDGELWTLDQLAFRAILMKRTSHENLLKVLSAVSIFKPLSLPQLQRLGDSMQEQTIASGEKIITQGDHGDTFYIIAHGAAVCTLLDSETGTSTELLRLGQNDYFGERALLYDEPRAANVSATADCLVLKLDRPIFESVLGNIKSVLMADVQLRKPFSTVPTGKKTTDSYGDASFMGPGSPNGGHGRSSAVRTALKSTNFRVNNDKSIRLDVLTPRLYVSEIGEDIGVIGVFQEMIGDAPGVAYTLKTVSIKRVADLGIASHVNTEREVLGTLPATGFTPVLMATFIDTKCLYLALRGVYVSDIPGLMDELGGGQMSRDALRFYAACAVLGIKTIHKFGFMVRRVCADAMLISSTGYAMMSDLSCASRMTGNRQYTLCGHYQYLAPEQIGGQGYDFGADYWALGVLIYVMATCSYPFGNEDTREEDLFAAVLKGEVAYPDDMVPSLKSLLQDLFQVDAQKRPDYNAIMDHAYFKSAAFDWQGLINMDMEAPHNELCRTKFSSTTGHGAKLNNFIDSAVSASDAEVTLFPEF